MSPSTALFSTATYNLLHSLVFRPDYPGYKPTVKEIPNGDGNVDAEKRYAHIAPKYLTDPWQRAALMPYMEAAHALALKAAHLACIPFKYHPCLEYSAMRVLDYPPGAISNKHEDFDLFTLMCYRDQPLCFRADEVDMSPELRLIKSVNWQAHLGQLGEAIGLGKATPHEVLPSAYRQGSIVYFAIPDHNVALPDGTLVRDWLNERMARSRTAFKAYE